jgi:hypothetical protein
LIIAKPVEDATVLRNHTLKSGQRARDSRPARELSAARLRPLQKTARGTAARRKTGVGWRNTVSFHHGETWSGLGWRHKAIEVAKIALSHMKKLCQL